MTHYRGEWRKAVEAAIRADRRYRDVVAVRPWNQALSAEELPALSVATEREEVTQVTKAVVRRSVTLTVRLWRRDDGQGQLDDTLDDDAAVIEPMVLGALRLLAWEVNATGTEIMFDGQTRVGMLALTFEVIRHTPEGAPLIAD